MVKYKVEKETVREAILFLYEILYIYPQLIGFEYKGLILTLIFDSEIEDFKYKYDTI